MNQSPLAGRHLAANAKIVDVGGWLMPIEYPATGAIVCVNIETSSLWAEFVNKNRSVFV